MAYYNLKTDDKGSNLDISSNYSSSVNASLGCMQYESGVNSHELVPYSRFQQNSTVNSYGYEFKGSYSHFYNNGSSLETGYEFNDSHISNDYVRNDYNGNEYIKNEKNSNLFEYIENVNAFYFTYDREWNDVISTSEVVEALVKMVNTDAKYNSINYFIGELYCNHEPQVVGARPMSVKEAMQYVS